MVQEKKTFFSSLSKERMSWRLNKNIIEQASVAKATNTKTSGKGALISTLQHGIMKAVSEGDVKQANLLRAQLRVAANVPKISVPSQQPKAAAKAAPKVASAAHGARPKPMMHM